MEGKKTPSKGGIMLKEFIYVQWKHNIYEELRKHEIKLRRQFCVQSYFLVRYYHQNKEMIYNDNTTTIHFL